MSFSLTTILKSIRFVLTVATYMNLLVWHRDVNTVFLNDYLEMIETFVYSNLRIMQKANNIL